MNIKRTDLAIEIIKPKKTKLNNNIDISKIKITKKLEKVYKKKKGNYITIEFKKIDKKELVKYLTKEINNLKKKNKINKKSSCLVIGLGNKCITPDSLGPKVIENIIVNNKIFALAPGVSGDTGIETYKIISALAKEINPDFILVIDSLKSSSIKWLNRTIQLTDTGISPGSGIKNKRKEISKESLNIPVIAIGVPTVIDSLLFNKKENNLIVTDASIDLIIEEFSLIISQAINKSLLNL